MNYLSNFLERFNDNHAVRLGTCLVPGLVLGRLEAQFGDGNLLSIFSSFVLIGGVAVYILWPRIRAALTEQDDEAQFPDTAEAQPPSPTVSPGTVSVPVVVGAVDLRNMKELVQLCNGRADVALDQVELEIELDDKISYSVAIEKATLRQRRLANRA